MVQYKQLYTNRLKNQRQPNESSTCWPATFISPLTRRYPTWDEGKFRVKHRRPNMPNGCGPTPHINLHRHQVPGLRDSTKWVIRHVPGKVRLPSSCRTPARSSGQNKPSSLTKCPEPTPTSPKTSRTLLQRCTSQCGKGSPTTRNKRSRTDQSIDIVLLIS